MSQEKKPFGYFGYRKHKSLGWRSFWNTTDLERLKTWLEDPPAEDDSPEESDAVVPTPTEASKIEPDTAEESGSPEEPEKHHLEEILERAVRANLGQHHLVNTGFMAKMVFSRIIANNEVFSPAKAGGQMIEETDDYAIYGLSEDRFFKVLSARNRLDRIEEGLDNLPSATLMSIVARFDSSLSELVRALLRRNPNRYLSDEKSISIRTIISMTSFEDVIDKAIDDETYSFSRGSHEEQVKFIESKFNISIIEHWKRWPDFIEIFERRNLVAHGEKYFTARYALNCKKNRHKGSEKLVGDRIELTKPYLEQALDVLLECEILLIFSLWRKQSEDDEQKAFSALVNSVFELIKDRRYRLSTRIIEYALGLKGTNASEMSRRMLAVNLASSYKHLENDEKCREILDSYEWDVIADNFKICVSALRGDVDGVAKLMKAVHDAGTVDKHAFREWPVFDFIREKGPFAEKFLEIFGEPLFEDVRPENGSNEASTQGDSALEKLDLTAAEDADDTSETRH